MSTRIADARIERFPLREPFVIARGAKTEAIVVTCTIADGDAIGRGEALPYPRYGERPEDVLAAIRGYAGPLDREGLARTLPPGAARNAIDLGLWDLDAKRSGVRVHVLAGLPAPSVVPIAYTLTLRDPDATRELARAHARRPMLKLKLGGDGDVERVRAAREGAPDARLIVDVNEGWDRAALDRNVEALSALGVELIEQPLPAGEDDALVGYDGPIPLCADESFVGGREQLAGLGARYRAVNVKLDKTGGLTEAIACVRAARDAGLDVMVGSMVASSLAVAPGVLLAQGARWADLDGPLYLAADRAPGLSFGVGTVHPPEPALWG
ncbi:MAG: N-acetyl-D-Glu racemase DgcA [Sandaracinaceae bacterium]